jgi:undecaprenyl pyrophosphate phosphatase UppP
MAEIGYKQAKRRYVRIFWPLIAFYMLACIAGVAFLKRIDEPSEWLRTLVAVVTVAPVAVVLWAIWRQTQETDEFVRKTQLEALAIAGMVMAGLAGIIGFLQLFDVVPEFGSFYALPGFFLIFGVAKWLRGGGCA